MPPNCDFRAALAKETRVLSAYVRVTTSDKNGEGYDDKKIEGTAAKLKQLGIPEDPERDCESDQDGTEMCTTVYFNGKAETITADPTTLLKGLWAAFVAHHATLTSFCFSLETPSHILLCDWGVVRTTCDGEGRMLDMKEALEDSYWGDQERFDLEVTPLILHGVERPVRRKADLFDVRKPEDLQRLDEEYVAWRELSPETRERHGIEA